MWTIETAQTDTVTTPGLKTQMDSKHKRGGEHLLTTPGLKTQMDSKHNRGGEHLQLIFGDSRDDKSRSYDE